MRFNEDSRNAEIECRPPDILICSFLLVLSLVFLFWIFHMDVKKISIPETVPLPPRLEVYPIPMDIEPYLPDAADREFSVIPEKAGEWLVRETGAKRELADKIAEKASGFKHGLALLAILEVESDARPALKYGNNYGLCQISTVHLDGKEQNRVKKLGYKSVGDCGVRSASDLFDIEKNLCSANAVFDRILNECGGNYKKAFKKYNANPRFREKYSVRVMQNYKKLSDMVKTGKI